MDEFERMAEPESESSAEPLKKRRKESLGQTIGGVLFSFEQQVLRTMPPSQELVHHARPDNPIPAGDGSIIHIAMPGVALPDAADPDAGDLADGDAHPPGEARSPDGA